MGLIIDHLEEEIFMKNNVRFRMIGEMERIPAPVQARIHHCMERTAANDKMTRTRALSYSSRWELTQTMQNIARKVIAKEIQPADITEEYISQQLQTSFMPDPDLLIRTGGEFRISNYLLWQCAYTELYFCNTFWPDFDEAEFRKAIADFQSRERRFGKTSEQVAIK